MKFSIRLFFISLLSIIKYSHSNSYSNKEKNIKLKWKTSNQLEYTFEHYKIEFNKSYKTEGEHIFREMIYQKNLRKVNEINSNKSYTWKAAINHFSDRDISEISDLMGKNRDLRFFTSNNNKFTLKKNSFFLMDIPDKIDWREQGVTSPVSAQGNCGACWAFSVAAVIESHISIYNPGKSVRVSVQELVDCVENPHKCGGNGGCDGATQEIGFDYIKNNGISLSSDYPYFAKKGECKNKIKEKIASIGSFVKLPENDYDSLMQTVANNGPVAISVAATEWALYDSGVFNSFCGTEVNHAVTLEGYGTDENGNNYWLVRNSWGEDWGEKGYIRVKREKSAKEVVCGVDKNPLQGSACVGGPKEVTVCGHCGILSDSCVPLEVKLLK
jgi:cathepsin L